MPEAALSLPAHSQLAEPWVRQHFEAAGFTVTVRPTDWGLSGARRAVFLVRRGLAVAWCHRKSRTLVLATPGIETIVVALLKPRRQRLFVFDLLPPRGRLTGLLAAAALKRVEKVLVVRSGDTVLLQDRFHHPRERTAFVPFPVTVTQPAGVAPVDENFIYSAGAAHRDYPTLMAALAEVSAPAIISTDLHRVPDPPRTTEVRAPMSPKEGRAVMLRSSVVAACFEDSIWPAGPLIVLDALALGKPVVATDFNGSRDYVVDGVTGFLVEPGHPGAVADRLHPALDCG